MELLISIFENSSAKGSFRSNKINYEILQLSADSRYLQSGPLKTEKLIYLFLHNNLSLFADQYIRDKKSIALKKPLH